MTPGWIKKESGKAEATARAKAEHDAWVKRAMALDKERKAFHAEKPASPAKTMRRGMKPGTRALPALSDGDLRAALAVATTDQPRHLTYPHLLILRERGYTVPVWGDDTRYAVPIYRGDLITEEGKIWLNQPQG